jgi:hypothetical protein
VEIAKCKSTTPPMLIDFECGNSSWCTHFFLTATSYHVWRPTESLSVMVLQGQSRLRGPRTKDIGEKLYSAIPQNGKDYDRYSRRKLGY